MRLAAPIGIGIVLLAVVGVLAWLRPRETHPPQRVPSAVEDPIGEPRVAPLRNPGSSPAGVPTAVLAGRVLRDGHSVSDARIIVRTGEGESLEVRSDANGRFRFDPISPGRLFVSAITGAEASEVLGPLSLAPGERREDLVLELEVAAAVAGEVLDVRTRRPIPGATLQSSAGTAVADHAGRFRLAPLPRGKTWIQAGARGFETRMQWLTLDAARGHSGLEIFLRAAANVRGSVTRLGEPVPGATVWAERAELAAGAERFGPVVTDGQGRFELAVATGVVQLAAAAPSAARVPGPRLTVAEGAAYEDLRIELGQPLSAQGFLIIDGGPGEGAAVVLLDARSQQLAGSTSTDAGGAFRFDGVPAGSYLVQVRAGSAIVQRGPFDVTGADDPPWQVEIDIGSELRGRVVPAQAGVLVRWRSSEWAGPFATETATDRSGAFSFRGVPDGALVVEAEADGASARAVGSSAAPVVLTLTPSAISGYVVDERGRAVTDFVVRVLPQDEGPSRLFPVLNPRGDFRVAVPPGRYEVSARAAGYGETAAEPVEVAPGRQGAAVKLVFAPTHAVSAQVVDSDSGAPLAGVEVTMLYPRVARAVQFQRWVVLTTGADGRFELGAAPARASLRLRREGYRTLWLRPDQVTSLPDGIVRMARGGSRGAAEPYEGVGMYLRPEKGNGVFVDATFEGGPAEAAGIRPNDEILMVDGVPVGSFPLDQVTARIMGPSGTLVRLTLKRGERVFDVVLLRRTIQL
jgi:Carboxypeptidase regulatory-like domain/PDZ domain